MLAFRDIQAILTSAALVSLSISALAGEAEIIHLIGHGDFRPPWTDDWKHAAINQHLDGGSYVRTGDLSQMALLLEDQTQLRLNQNSILQIREVAAAGQPTRLELSAGRAWMQAKARPATTAAGTPPVLEVRTPNATAAIRGTDWDIEVAQDGAVTLTVFSGEVALYNDIGQVSVAANEQAHVEPGKAPVKRFLVNARERVQWVTAYSPRPRRWISRPSPALDPAIAAIERQDYATATRLLTGDDADNAVLRADLLLHQGRVRQAAALLDEVRRRYPDDPRLIVLLARARLFDDETPQALALIDAALEQRPEEAALWLARAETTRAAGDAPAVRDALEKARQLDPRQAETWFGLGRYAAEREDVRTARSHLERALAAEPAGPGYRGELATLETFADRLDAAEKAFLQALADQPGDYVALTGMGLLRLKQGRAEEALTALLKAGAIEPRHARTAMYTGIAYYQLDRHDRAAEALRKAAELDPLDPLPHMMLSRIAADRMDFGTAIAEARRTSELMPYLKSLNQLANDQKGTINVGSALAQFGLEEWALAHAYNAQTTYWAGSHLFLADRHLGEFNKNSELYQGFLSDPTVFGASNRHSDLVTRPGHHAGIEFIRAREDLGYPQFAGSANGYFSAPWPLAYYVNAEQTDFRPRHLEASGNTLSTTLGLGARPDHDLGLFLFNTRRRMDFIWNADAAGLQYIDDRVASIIERSDIGAHYRFAPDSHLWLKLGQGRNDRDLEGGFLYPAFTEQMSEAVGFPLPANGLLAQRSRTRVDDWHLRHVVDIGRSWQFGWGFEGGRNTTRNDTALLVLPIVSEVQEQTTLTSQDLHLGNRFRLGRDLTVQADLSRQQLTRNRDYRRDTALVLFDVVGLPTVEAQNRIKLVEWNPRLGISWQPAAGSMLRLAAQHWRKPAAASTLSAIDTAGIALDDRLVATGGKLRRIRAQYEWQPGATPFFQAWADRRTIRNLVNDNGDLLEGVAVPDLDRLRNKPSFIAQPYDALEDTPEFGTARITTLGLAGNFLVNDYWSLAARYHHNDSANLGAAFAGMQVPWLPKHMFNLTLNWLPASRWQVALRSTFRSSRYMDEANGQPVAAGWLFGLHGYWESADKRLYAEGMIDNIKGRKEASARPTLYGLRLGYRF